MNADASHIDPCALSRSGAAAALATLLAAAGALAETALDAYRKRCADAR